MSMWQKPLQYCKVISLQLIKINGEKINIQMVALKEKDITILNAYMSKKNLKIYE